MKEEMKVVMGAGAAEGVQLQRGALRLPAPITFLGLQSCRLGLRRRGWD